MSVYKPAKSRFYHYDFVHKGRRVHGSTGVETRRRAEAVERKVREELAEGRLDDAAQMTIDTAAAKWWAEKGEGLRSASDRDRQLAVVMSLLGPKTRLAEIDTKKVGDAIQRRRNMTFTRGTTTRRPSNATVNRDVIDALRPILRRARKAWGAKGLPDIDWGELRLTEPKPKPKEFTDGEFEALLAATQHYWHDLIRFVACYGPRISEAFFPLSALDVADRNNARVILRARKGDDDHVIPLLPNDADMLAARAGRARAAGLDTVWFRELSTRGGKLVALKPSGAVRRLSEAMTDAGVRASKGMRGSHDLRRNSAMKILRATGNLRVAQKLLGHASIVSTLVYAHAVEEDVKAGLAALSRNSPEPEAGDAKIRETDQPSKAS